MTVTHFDRPTHADRMRQEAQAMDAVAARLRARYPHIDPGRIERAVRHHYATYEHARIRDFLPVLVERAVRDTLG